MILLIALFGLFIGGINNALADDLPHYRWPRLPRYADDTPRPPIAWLGTLAFLTGNRRDLSWRYPLTEFATAALFVTTLWRIEPIIAGGDPVNTLQVTFWLFYVAVMVLITVIDIEHHLILFSVIIPSTLIALLDAILTPTNPPYGMWAASAEPTLVEALIGGGVGFAVFFVFYIGGFIYSQVSSVLRGEAISEVAFGYGDVMLITLSGIILGWRALIFAMFITVVMGAIGAIIYLIAQRIMGGRGGMLSPIPYGPYIVIGTLVMLLFSDAVREILIYNLYIR